MSNDHPLLKELHEICLKNDISEGNAKLAFELYLELCEVQKLWDVENHFCEELKLFYFTGRCDKNSDHEAYVPITVDKCFSMEDVEDMQRCLSPETKSIVLVFKDRDSSSTYYKITNGLVKPDSPRTGNRKKYDEKAKEKFQKDLTKWRRNLYSRAVEDEEDS